MSFGEIKHNEVESTVQSEADLLIPTEDNRRKLQVYEAQPKTDSSEDNRKQREVPIHSRLEPLDYEKRDNLHLDRIHSRFDESSNNSPVEENDVKLHDDTESSEERHSVADSETNPHIQGKESIDKKSNSDVDGKSVMFSDKRLDDLDASETSNVIKDFVGQNVRELTLPKNNGTWEGERGNSKWVPNPEATFRWQKNGDHEITYGELMKKYNFDGIEYSNNEPDFEPFEDAFLGHAEIDNFSADRDGPNGTYAQARKAIVERLSQESGVSWTESQVQDYMNDHGLTFHECSDRRTVRVIPTEINAAFKHTGGIGIERSINAVSSALDDRFDGKGFSLVQDSPAAIVDRKDLETAIQATKKSFH